MKVVTCCTSLYHIFHYIQFIVFIVHLLTSVVKWLEHRFSKWRHFQNGDISEILGSASGFVPMLKTNLTMSGCLWYYRCFRFS